VGNVDRDEIETAAREGDKDMVVEARPVLILVK
jgi:hypothetical protein